MQLWGDMLSKNSKTIEKMFSEIAPRYDFLNRLLSGGVDRYWRKVCTCYLSPGKGQYLDVATGTGDLSLELRKQSSEAEITAIDFSMEMLKICKTKVAGKSIRIGRGNALSLSFKDETFDGITSAFGIRNFENLELGLKEMLRVLKPGGKISILEFTTPSNRLVRALYLTYFTKILPGIGGLISGSSSAYSYLPKSAVNFPNRTLLTKIFESAGFASISVKPLTFGICDLIVGVKPTGKEL